MSEKIRSHRDLGVYKRAFKAAMRIFELSKGFPKEETYSLTDQIRRSSRSVCTCLAEAWRKRRYVAAFISKVSDSETEAAETQSWLEFAVACGYMARETGKELYVEYDEIIGTLVGMINHPESWIISHSPPSKPRADRPIYQSIRSERPAVRSPCHLVTLSPCHLVSRSPRSRT